MKFTSIHTSMRVRPADLDILGHVNNAVVLEYLEAGRWAWMNAHGIKRQHHIVPVVTRVEIDYRREIGMQDLVVQTELRDPPTDFDDDIFRVVFQQRVLTDNESVATEALVSVGFLDAQSRTLRTLNEYLSTETR